VGQATEPLNGELIRTEAEELVGRFHTLEAADPAFVLPREVVLELNTTRATRPVFWPGCAHTIRRPELSLDRARRLFDELAELDDTRVTLAGVGDPLLAANVLDTLEAAARAGLSAVHLQTDLLGVEPDTVAALAAAPLDVVSVHLPALTAATYAATMGVDGYASALENVRLLLAARTARRRGVPLLVPVFTKCHTNLGEAEAWRAHWLRAVGSAVLRSPGNYGGLAQAAPTTDGAPPRRVACARLTSRMTVLSDGRVVSCEEDVHGRQVLGEVGTQSIKDIWRQRFGPLRDDHRAGNWSRHPLCASCSQWHRP
jgi:MoaA/NifB/PqqE/SkfB family radical SAM enzyme